MFSREAAAQLEGNTGFNDQVVSSLAKKFNSQDVEALTLALCIAHQNCKNVTLPTIYRGIFGGQPVPVSTLAGRVDRELLRHFNVPMLTQLHRRYDLADGVFHNCVYLLDGTTVDVRLHDSQAGHKGWNANFQVLHDVSGEFITYSGPYSGRLPDCRNFNGDPTDVLRVTGFCDPACITPLRFPHKQDEIIVADGIYKANLHCMVPYEGIDADPDPTRPLETRKKMCFNRHMKIVRSRVERRYAAFKGHNMFQSTARTVTAVALFWRVTWNAEMEKINLDKDQGQPTSVVDEVYDGRARYLGEDCQCDWNGMWYANHPSRHRFLQYRDAYCEYLWSTTNGRMRISRISANASKVRRANHQHRVAAGEHLQF